MRVSNRSTSYTKIWSLELLLWSWGDSLGNPKYILRKKKTGVFAPKLDWIHMEPAGGKDFSNTAGEYHGFCTSDISKIDPGFGSPELLRDLVQDAHALNMRVPFGCAGESCLCQGHEVQGKSYSGKGEQMYHRNRNGLLGAWSRLSSHSKWEPTEFGLFRLAQVSSTWILLRPLWSEGYV